MAAVFNPDFYQGGKRYVHSKHLHILTYCDGSMFRYLFLLYNDREELFAFRHGRTVHPNEHMAYISATDLLEVAVIHEVQ